VQLLFNYLMLFVDLFKMFQLVFLLLYFWRHIFELNLILLCII